MTLTLATVNNPQMVDMEQLKGDFESEHPDIKVKFVQMEENDLRDAVTKDVATQGGQYDMVTIGAYEVPLWQKNDWIQNLSPYVEKSEDYDVDDLMPPVREAISVDDDLYAVPFYGESSFLMYNKDIFKAAGLTMPEKPTWTQVADLAKKAKSAESAGICLRGKPGWGEVLAPLTTVVNTFGGTWFDEGWNAKVNAPEFKQATEFYVKLVREHGEAGAPQAGFSECLNNMTQGKVAMWYDATSAAGSLEGEGSPVAGKMGYAQAPVVKTDSSGWLYSWAWGIQKAGKNQDNAAKFIAFASGKEYEELVGAELGWAKVPAGKRASTYENEDYLKEASAFAGPTQQAIESADPRNAGVDPRPYTGVQFVGIPEFPALGTAASQEISSAIAGRTPVAAALDKSQELAETVGQKYK